MPRVKCLVIIWTLIIVSYLSVWYNYFAIGLIYSPFIF